MKKAAPKKKKKSSSPQKVESTAAISSLSFSNSVQGQTESLDLKKVTRRLVPDIQPSANSVPPPPPPPVLQEDSLLSEEIFGKNVVPAIPKRQSEGAEEAKTNDVKLNDWLDRDALLQRKNALRQITNRRGGSVIAGRERLFDRHGIFTHFPLETLKDAFVFRGQTLTEINLIGVEQVTDMFFLYVKRLFGNDTFVKYVERVVITGCPHITDLSLETITVLFPNLQKVNVIGCINITNRGLNNMRDKLPQLQNLVASGTKVSIVYPIGDERTNVVTKLAGCPVVSPEITSDAMYAADSASKHQYYSDLVEEPMVADFRALVITYPDLNTSILDVLSGRTRAEPTHFGTATFSGSDGSKYHLIECTSKNFGMLSTPRTLYLLPVQQEKNFMHHIIQMIVSILLTDPYAVFCVIGISEETTSANNLEGTKDLIFSTLAEDKSGSLFNNIRQKCQDVTNHVAQALQKLDFHMQRVYSNLWKMINALNDDLKSRIHVCSIDAANKKEAVVAIDNCMQAALPGLRERNKSYTRLPKSLLQIFDSITKEKAIQPLSFVTEPLRKKHSSLHGTHLDNYSAILDIMEILGRVIQMTADDTAYIVTDQEWFSEVMSCILSFPTTKVGENVLCVHPDTEAFYLPDLYAKLNQKFPSEEEMKRGLDIIRKAFRLGWIEGDWIVPIDNLKVETPVPIEPFLELEEGTPSAKVTYKFDVPYSDTVVKDAICEITHIVKPFLVWNKGLYFQHIPVQIMIKFSTQKTKGLLPTTKAELLVTGIKVPAASYKLIDDLMYDHMVRYRIMLEYVFRRHNLSYTYGNSFEFKADLAGLTASSAFEKGDGTNFMYKHTLIAEARCENCDEDMLGIKRLWEMRSDLWPTFCGTSYSSIGQLKQQGSWFDIPPSVTKQTGGLNWSYHLSPYNFNEFEVTFINNAPSAQIALIVEDKDKGKIETFRIRAAEKGKGGDDGLTAFERLRENEKDEVVAMTPGDIGQGRVVRVRYLPDTKENHKLQFICGGEKVMEGAVSARNSMSVSLQISAETQVTFLLSAPKCPAPNSAKSWEIGMRLEATDRLNPNLICAATITDTKEEEDEMKVLIHFDGWTERYDYWTKISAHDLHPIDFTRQKGHLIGYNKLEAPKGYRKRFDWNTYLNEVKCLPVPYDLFSETWLRSFESKRKEHDTYVIDLSLHVEQTKGCTEYAVTYDDDINLPELRTGAAVKSCTKSRISVGKLKKDFGMENQERTEELVKDLTGRNTLLVPLPKDLDMGKLCYPKIPNLQEQSLNFLCGNNGYLHFIDMNGLPMDKTALDVITTKTHRILPAVIAKLITQKHILPMNVKTLIKGATEVPLQKLEGLLRNLLTNYMFSLLITLHSQSSVEAYKRISNEYEELCKSTLDVGMREHDLAEHLKVDNDSVYWCNAHMAAAPEIALQELPMEQLKSHYHLTTTLRLSRNSISELPTDLFQTMPALMVLDIAENKVSQLPEFSNATGLVQLDMSKNKITTIPTDIGKCPIHTLNISGNDLGGIPESVFAIEELKYLEAANVGLTNLQNTIKNLTLLEELNISGHCLEVLPSGIGDLVNLRTLNISAIPWFNQDNNRAVLSRQAFDDFMDSNPITAKLSEKEKDSLFNGDVAGQQSTLDYKSIVKLNTSIFLMFPRLGSSTVDTDAGEDESKSNEDILAPIFGLTKLTDLTMNYLGIKAVQDSVASLAELKVLDVSHNPSLETISSEVGVLSNLTVLHMKDCNLLKTPPKEIVRRGFKAIMGYLRRLQMGSVSCKRTKLMMVGLGGAGKTSTMKALMSHRHQSDGDAYVTDGIDIMTWKVCYDNTDGKDNSVTYSVWDFAGQTVYYNTHQFFLSNRAIYLLMWNVRLGHEHAGLDFWLSSIACHAPKAPILVIGTHIDQVEKFWLPSEEIQKRYPQICGFHSVSSYTGEGIDELAREIYTVALKEKYMGEKIPQAWLSMEEAIVRRKTEKQESLLEWEAVEAIAETAGIVETSEVLQAIRFLHDLGSIQHFDNDFLRSKVVINPQWIVNVMSCVVSVHENAIKDGKLLHKDLGKIWSDYDPSLHQWLLRLTEEFDLTFPLHTGTANLVACLLPDVKPEFTWEDISDIPGQQETKMIYKFEYLPAGLFNRAQVRLHQYSDDAVLWKKGSLLHKTGHKALMTQKSGAQVEVRVQGSCPENFLFLVHEVYETLIFEAYNGVSYDYLIPCSDCIKVGTYDPCMFEASKIRRATELKVPFLQCDKYFHTLSLTEIHASMPPDSSADFDAHLERSIRDLKDLRSDMATDVFMFYCPGDVPQSFDEKMVDPRRIYSDLEAEGFKVWFPSDPNSINLKSIALTMKNAKVILMLVSDKFVTDNDCCNVFYYAKHTLNKRLQVVVLGGNQWPKSDIGLQLASEVYIKMDDKKRYVHKKPELTQAISSKTETKKVVHPKCFISYCWSNSHDAISKGSRKIEGALGWGDPRKFKDHIEKAGIPCWMDIEQVGQGGLFEDIATGLRHAKVIVACVSDEYAKSKNCQMELRFAVTTLKIPLVVVVVGTGYKWEASEMGMLTLGSPKINCQYESASAMERLLTAVKSILPEEKEDGKKNENNKNDGQQQAYQELLELAQRKFLRQVNVYASSMEALPYPRLFFLDFVTKEDKDSQGNPLLKDVGEENAEKTEGEMATKDFRSMQYVTRILCENEQGWHVSGDCVPVPMTPPAETEEYLDSIAPYAARIMAILKHTSLDCPVLTTEKGEALRAKFEENCSLDTDFKQEYTFFREFMIKADEAGKMGGLSKCHLPNGKLVWLCEEHRKADPRISKVTEDTGPSVEGEGLSINPDQLSQSKKIKTRGKLIGAGAAAIVAASHGLKDSQNSQACSVM